MSRIPPAVSPNEERCQAYCKEVIQLLHGAADENSFLERAKQLDERYLLAMFAQRFGSADADPHEALRRPPSFGTGSGVHQGMENPILAKPEGSIARRAMETYERHAQLLTGRGGLQQISKGNSGNAPAPPMPSHEGFQTAAFGLYDPLQPQRGTYDPAQQLRGTYDPLGSYDPLQPPRGYDLY
eukprot:gnl/MRDRNA2_/MRDRNA2_122440_c0_seq1.p1 gnl/MRDRNA2_/MRDRNA2_122440_c0~~gnl/MRDRNA2_/MRDRNA2_122440_c0_seq1.p1  ORF type:complete len:184 (+),score=38.67 gnl/MRDRNA2_/MRDRNA2_122440_c0_seq1:70-621(+)